ncbi:MAG: NUDIX domain-containing protein [Anaerolineaceae bacterium]
MTSTAEDPSTSRAYPMPLTRIELAVLSIVDGSLAVLLGKREQLPHRGKWALPGGVLRIDRDGDLKDAAQRVAHERLEVALPFLRLQTAVGSKSRDPRAPWALAIVYRALVPFAAIDPKAGKRLEALRWVAVDDAVADARLAFDHAELIRGATEATRAEIDRLDLPFDFLPQKFTLGELQTMCEAMLGRRLDKSSFRRRLEERELLQPVRGEMRTGAFRPAQLYRRR